MTTVFRLQHRHFALTVLATSASGGAYAFRVEQDGQPLHTSRAVYRTVAGADRAGRCFVDDALDAYAWAAGWMDETYSSSK